MNKYSVKIGILGLLCVFGQLIHVNAQSADVVHTLSAKAKGTWIPSYLPKSKLLVRIQIEKKISEKGELADYTPQYFNSDKYIKESNTTYTIKGFSIDQKYVKDLSKVYYVQPTSGTELEFNTQGILVGMNSHDKSAKSNIEKTQNSVTYNQLDRKPMLSMATKFDTVVTREYTQDSSVIERRSINRVFVKNQAGDLARETANKINEVRAQKLNLVSGPEDVHLDGKAMEISLRELNKLEDEYLFMFFGEEKNITETIEIELIPTTESDQMITLGKFSNSEGWDKGIISVKLRLKSDSKDVSRPLTVGSIPYYEPQETSIELMLGTSVISTESVVIPQLGVLRSLPISSEKSVKIKLDSKTGALLRFSK